MDLPKLLCFYIQLIVLISTSRMELSAQFFDPILPPFKGEVYIVPEDWRPYGYGPYIEEQDPIQEVEWRRIEVPDQDITHKFKDIDLKYGFGILFKNVMKLDTAGYYIFNLASDDGSRLWIDEQEVIDNDGDHAYRMMSDTIILDKGFHRVKIWYYQAYALRYGVNFSAKFYNFYDGIVPKISGKDTITISTDNLFDFDSDKPAISALELTSLLGLMTCDSLTQLEVIGHTDSVGNKDYNFNLSIRRAKAIANMLEETCPKYSISFDGRGESQPKVANNTKEGRGINRRVEIIIIK